MTETIPHIDRRRLERLGCRCATPSQSGVLILGGRSYCVSLMDLHVQGARLRFMDLSSTAAVDVGDACRFNLLIEPQGLESGPVPCHIAWKMGGDVGICFNGLWNGLPVLKH